ncbi:hypothetical protein T07_13951 [Trichinella nelsoni]|uniref:Uncharacterized protein n=1 Tax=Trichinella nelsoni TaxID=6336 RepID=A0A0V0RB53_9BILA|nr:hypothetical protein T07_13951 [Trichinella nelsoni]
MIHFLSIHLRAEPAPSKSRTFHQADKLLTPIPQSKVYWERLVRLIKKSGVDRHAGSMQDRSRETMYRLLPKSKPAVCTTN